MGLLDRAYKGAISASATFRDAAAAGLRFSESQGLDAGRLISFAVFPIGLYALYRGKSLVELLESDRSGNKYNPEEIETKLSTYCKSYNLDTFSKYT